MSRRIYRPPPKKGPKSRKAKIDNMPGRGLWVPCRACPCCGNFVVKLRIADEKRRFVICYFKGWDGSPWYTPRERILEGGYANGNAVAHMYRGNWDRRRLMKPREPKKTGDPFFSLDTEPIPRS